MTIPQAIENHGVIGDLTTAALVAMDGSIDFMCFPHFDSPTIFASLLDPERGGRFQIAPAKGEFRRRQRYLPDTNILLTRFLSEGGVAELSDFMPMRHLGHGHALVRRLKVVRGDIVFRMVCAPRFDYGRARHSVERRDGEILFRSRGRDGTVLRLRTAVTAREADGAAIAEFRLRTGQTAAFVLEDAAAHRQSPSANADYLSDAFKETMNFWLGWVGRSRYRGRWREMVNRSALTLKLLTSRPHGSIIAAPTFGLPERVGGRRNWDYRYTWIRDSSFTLDALMRLGYRTEATAFMNWIEERSREQTPGRLLQVVYRMDGGRDLRETELRRFSGYLNSRPVRIGNGAHRQLQLDIYGELLDSVHRYSSHGGAISYEFWTYLQKLVDWVCANWRRPDEGIWEVRGGRKPFLYSRVSCWVAIDRGIRLAQARAFPAPLDRWRGVRDRIYKDVYQNFWNSRLRAFVQYRGAKAVDAASLLMPLFDFVGPTDPRWRSTLKEIERALVEDSLVFRYDPRLAAPDGFTRGEGTFSVCSFWYVECLARSGDLKQARFIFEKALGYANHLGLYAEQLGPFGEHLGNFPQALSHIALIGAASTLDERLTEAEQERGLDSTP